MKKNMLKKLIFLSFLGLAGCYSEENFNGNPIVEGSYFCDIESIWETNRNFKPKTWNIFQEENDLFITSQYANFVAQVDEQANITTKDFVGVNFMIDFEGSYYNQNIEGILDREYLDYDWKTKLYISGEKENWAEPTNACIDIKGFYDLEANILEQDCVTESAEHYLFPSQFDWPAFVFQKDNSIYLWAYGMKLQKNINEDGSFIIEKIWETGRCTFYIKFYGNFTEDDLQGTFEFEYDYFNTGEIKCSSKTEIYGNSIKPWNQEELIEKAFSNDRPIYFTALDYVMFHE